MLRCRLADATSQVTAIVMLRSRVAVWQFGWCCVAGHDLLRRRSRIAMSQVGFSRWDLRRCGSYSSDFRRRSPANNRTCDTRVRDRRPRSEGPATPEGQTCDPREADLRHKSEGPATPEWQTCDVLSKGSILVQANVI